MINPFPKPSIQKFKPERLPERKAVTIVAGFKTKGGIVICADTQETIGSLSKRNVPKLRFEPLGPRKRLALGTDLAVAFCGASNNGPFIDKIVDRAWEAAHVESSLDGACAAIENCIKSTYREFGEIYQQGCCPEAELIYGIKMNGASKLFSALGPVVNEKDTYATGGAGYYMADFLASRMYAEYLSLYQCAILAAYILFQAKEHVDGCGGESQIAVLKNNGLSSMARPEKVERITELLKYADHMAGPLILDMANLDLSDKAVMEKGVEVLRAMKGLRRLERSDKKIRMSNVPTDTLGFPLP
jgi:20S proteasome alpha/beta subunit